MTLTKLHGLVAGAASGLSPDRSASAGPWQIAPVHPVCLCGGESVVTLAAGCVHEHLAEQPLCQFHVEDIAHGLMVCGACLAVDGHRCELVALREVAA
jgi:hypothetical protein